MSHVCVTPIWSRISRQGNTREKLSRISKSETIITEILYYLARAQPYLFMKTGEKTNNLIYLARTISLTYLPRYLYYITEKNLIAVINKTPLSQSATTKNLNARLALLNFSVPSVIARLESTLFTLKISCSHLPITKKGPASRRAARLVFDRLLRCALHKLYLYTLWLQQESEREREREAGKTCLGQQRRTGTVSASTFDHNIKTNGPDARVRRRRRSHEEDVIHREKCRWVARGKWNCHSLKLSGTIGF